MPQGGGSQQTKGQGQARIHYGLLSLKRFREGREGQGRQAGTGAEEEEAGKRKTTEGSCLLLPAGCRLCPSVTASKEKRMQPLRKRQV